MPRVNPNFLLGSALLPNLQGLGPMYINVTPKPCLVSNASGSSQDLVGHMSMRALAQEAATLAMEGLEADANSTKAAVKHVRAAVCPAPVADTDNLLLTAGKNLSTVSVYILYLLQIPATMQYLACLLPKSSPDMKVMQQSHDLTVVRIHYNRLKA